MPVVQTRHTESSDVHRDSGASDTALARQAVVDGSAFAELYLRYADRIFRYAYRRLATREAAEDATSLVFTKALSAIGRFDPDRGSFAAWLFSIASNVLIDQFRMVGRFLTVSVLHDAVDPSQSPEEVTIAREQAGDLRRALLQLAPREREVIELRLAGLSSAEISDVLGCHKNSVAQAQFRAIGRLRTLLGPGAERKGHQDV